jgi:hypothetical protein
LRETQTQGFNVFASVELATDFLVESILFFFSSHLLIRLLRSPVAVKMGSAFDKRY